MRMPNGEKDVSWGIQALYLTSPKERAKKRPIINAKGSSKDRIQAGIERSERKAKAKVH